MVLRKSFVLALLAAAMVPAVASAPLAGVYGARGSAVFHTSESCPAGRRIKPGNRVEFASEAEAKKDGRRLCKKCR